MIHTSETETGDMPAQNVILQGERLYESVIDHVISRAERELLIFDPDFSKGAYQSQHRFELVRSFLTKEKQNKLLLITHHAEFLSKHCMLLLGLLKTYQHKFSILETEEHAHAAREVILLADKKHYLHRFHLDHARFKYKLNAEEQVQPLLERFEQLRQVSKDVAFLTTLGL